ncbi:MAG: hypothetical protein WB662_03800 [Methyloceanibacter sp.]
MKEYKTARLSVNEIDGQATIEADVDWHVVSVLPLVYHTVEQDMHLTHVLVVFERDKPKS